MNTSKRGQFIQEVLPMAKKTFCFALVFSVFFLNVYPEENQESSKKKVSSLQHEIVVTANRVETPLKEIASSVTVITREELERMNKATVLEALQGVLGINIIQNGPPGGAASVFLRGANSEHTIVMMDGIELNDPISPSRSFDIAHLTLENVKSIEIIRGPQSTLYGSDAMGGVINIITQKGKGKPKFHLSTQSGAYRTFVGNAETSGSTDKIHYSFGTSYLHINGFSAASTQFPGNIEKDSYKNLTLSGRIGFLLLDNLEFDFSMKNLDTKTDIDNFGGAYGDDPNNIQEYDALILKGEVRGLFLQNRWEQKISLSFIDYHRKHENPTDDTHPFDSDHSVYESKQWKLDWQHNLFLHESNTLTFGVEYHEEQGESEYYSENIWGPYSSIFPLQKAHNTGIYIQDQIRLADQFFVTAGLRFDKHSQAGSSTTFRVAPAYFIKQTGTKFKATYGTGFKSPSLYQLFAPGTFWGPVGNENLEPEESKSWDAGIEQNLLQNKLTLGITYFSSKYENLVDFDFALGFINIRKASSKGAEFSLKAWPTNNLLFMASYTRTEAKDRGTDEYLLRRPKNKFTTKLNFNLLEKGNISLSLIHIGERYDMEWAGWFATRVKMPSYTLLNAAASYELSQNVQIFFRLDNILNEEYEMAKGYGTPGFSSYGGVKLNF